MSIGIGSTWDEDWCNSTIRQLQDENNQLLQEIKEMRQEIVELRAEVRRMELDLSHYQ